MTALALDPRRGAVRGVRAAVLTVPTVGAAAVVHSLADGCGSLAAIALAAGSCWPAAVALLGRRRSLPSLLAFVALAQVLTHVWLERTCPDVLSGQTGLVEHLRGSLTVSMVVLHAVAVLATAVLLGGADDRLWSTARLRRLARVRVTPLLLPVVPAHRVPVAPVAVPVPLIGRTVAPARRRGPPVAA